jgi:hypothetical protein
MDTHDIQKLLIFITTSLTSNIQLCMAQYGTKV